MSTEKLSEKHLLFVNEFMRDANPTAAMIRCGHAPRSAGPAGARLMSRPDIRAEIARRQAGIASSAAVSIISLLEEAEAARLIAEQSGNASGMVAASLLKAKLLGYMSMDSEERNQREQGEAERAQSAEIKSAARLLADAAASMNLPADSTPSEIVGAIGSTEIAPPELYVLLHSAQIQRGTA